MATYLTVIGAGCLLTLPLLVADPHDCAARTPSFAPSKELTPPRSSERAGCQQAPQVTVSRRAIDVEGEVVAAVKAGRVDAASKQGGSRGFLINPLLQQLTRQATRLRKIQQQSQGKTRFTGALRLIIDRRAPYRLVLEVLYTASKAGFSRFQLLVLSRDQAAPGHSRQSCVTIELPRPMAPGALDQGSEKPPGLVVAVGFRGFTVANQGTVLEGSGDREPTIACRQALEQDRCPVRLAAQEKDERDGYDYQALQRLASRLKRGQPNERRVIVVGELELRYQVLIRTLDALRAAPAKTPAKPSPLFDQVLLSAGFQ